MTIEQWQAFHRARAAVPVSCTVEKSATPLLWLDTSVILDLAKIDSGVGTEPVRMRRLGRLRAVALKAIEEEKLICPEWEQEEEYETLNQVEEARTVAGRFSRGARVYPREAIKDELIDIGLRAYLEMRPSMKVQARIWFREDPLKVVRDSRVSGYYAQARMQKPAELLARSTTAKRDSLDAFEEIRKTHATTESFTHRLALERIGEADAMIKMYAAWEQGVARGDDDLWAFMGVQGFLRHMRRWTELGGPGGSRYEQLSAIFAFMRSPYYWELPLVDISCRLFSDLLVNAHHIKSGDGYDVKHLSCAIPIAHYVVADKDMVSRCERLNIDKRWNTKLFVTRTLDELSDEIEALR